MKSFARTFLMALAAVVALADLCLAQSDYYFRDPSQVIQPPPAGVDGDWFTETDGDVNTSGGTNWEKLVKTPSVVNFIPDNTIGMGERAFIENGGMAFVSIVGPYSPGQILLGNATGTSGTLEIRSGGGLSTSTVVGSAFNGNITVGSAGTGTLRVLPGGTLTAASSLTEGANVANSIRVGGPTGATATLTAASANLASKVQVYPNASFSVTGGGSLTATSAYTSEVTANGVNGKINVGTTATVNGSLVLNFSGYAPAVGHNWNVLEANVLNGNFTSITSNATLPNNQALVASKPSIGGGKIGYNVGLHEVLVLEVNRDTGTATLKHPGNTNILLDGYFIGSNAGLLKPANWNSWDAGNHFGGDWLATDDTPNNLGELKPAGDATLNGGNTLNYQFGNVFDPFAGAFGAASEDLQFSYRRSSDGLQFPGKVLYTGTKVNTLVLQVDPTGTGNAFLRNTSNTSVEIDSYDILSTSGRLSPGNWTSLDGAATAWISVNSNANQLGEVNQSGFTTLAPGASLDLGKLYLGGTQDLAMAFLLRGQNAATTGKVLYEAFAGTTPILGDYNNNGIVDAADYTLWRNNLGQPAGSLMNRNPLNGGSINAADYSYWKSRFGATTNPGSGSVSGSPVPEPATWLMVALSLGLVSAARRGER